MSQGRIPEHVINQVRDRADIEAVVSSYVALSRAGQNLKGLCPFHSEKTPSFTVSSAKQMFYCFGCGTGGNVFSFVMKIEGMDFVEAVKEVGRRVGIPVASTEDRVGGGDATARKRLEQVTHAAAEWFRSNLWHADVGKIARGYLERRGIAQTTAESFGLGLALPAWDGLISRLRRNGFSPKEIASAGLAVARDHGAGRSDGTSGYNDRFRNRLMFPIQDLQRRTVAFGGRVLDDAEPKYLNSSDTPLFQKGRTLYALERARESASRMKSLVVVEGYFDAIALHQAGITNVVATLGTALTDDHVQTVRRFVGKVVLLFDPDPAGVRAALRSLDLFVNSGISVRVVSLPDGDDPDTFIRKHGPQAFRSLEERAPSLLDFAVEQGLGRAGSGSVEDRIRSVDDVLRILHRTGNRIEKEDCTRRVAERLGINQQRLIERYPELAQPQSKKPVSKTARDFPLRSREQVEERDLVYLLLQGQLPVSLIQGLDPLAFNDPSYRRIIELALEHRDPGGRIRLRELLDAVTHDEACGDVAVRLAMSEQHFDDARVHAQGCVEKLLQKNDAAKMSELIARLRTAEREGRTEEVRTLNGEINQLRLRKVGARTTGVV